MSSADLLLYGGIAALVVGIILILGLAIMLLGHLILYAIPKGDDDR